MKNELLQRAQELYFQTDLPKTKIADALGISRRTLHYWIEINGWDRMKKSGQAIPSFLAENIYQVIGNLTEHILSEERIGKPVTMQEANTMHRLTITIGKLKTRPTLNENMETFALFTDELLLSDPALAEKIQPHINSFIESQASPSHKQYRPTKINDKGHIPAKPAFDQALEDELDREDLVYWANEVKATQAQTASPAPSQASAASKNDQIPAPAPSEVYSGAATARAAGETIPPITTTLDRSFIEKSIRQNIGGNYKSKKHKHRHAA